MKKEIIFVIAVVLIVILSVFIIFMVSTKDTREVAKLRIEADKISKLDITKDDVDMNIKTSGEYAIVEQTMKDYMNKYASLVKDLSKILEDKKLANILTAENYKNDGPEFIDSKDYIASTRASFNEKINELEKMTKEETVINAIKDKNVSEEYVDLYKEIMLGEDMKKDLEETSKSLEESSVIINNILDVQDNVLSMLITNQDQWKINEEGAIEFTSQRLVDQYNKYLSSL